MKKSEIPRVRGRPRGFDRDRALAQAVRLFWERGYEGTAISELVKELRITPPALYTAFGSKEALFREALALYLHDGGSYFTEAIEDPDLSAREVVASILQQSARHFAGDGSGLSGCMLSTATLSCAPEHRAIADEVSATRRARRASLANRLDRAVTDGELPVGTDSNALAAFYMAVLQGMAIQARDGAETDSLLRMTVAAMNAWPTLERPIRADG